MDILELLKTDIQKAIGFIEKNQKHRLEAYTWEYLNKEFNGNARDLRNSQVGRIQKDKIVGTGEKAKSVTAIRLSIPFAKKIVNTAVAFELGEPVTLIADEKNELYDSVKSTWKLNRMDSKLQEALKKKKSELESCIIFHIEDVPRDKTWITKLFTTQKKRIKSNVKTNKEGRMYPIFDQYGNMQMFVWRFTSKSESHSEIDNIWIYTDKERIDLDNSVNNTYSITSRKPHGFDRIPVMYLQQDLPEWEDVKTIIDRFEVALSKLGGSNDYAGYPLLKLYGELVSMPDRNDDGKTLRFPMKEVDDTGKTIHGDAEFLTANNAAESVKLELEKLYSLIHAMSSTPDIAFENLKGLGAMSGIALKLMFLDAIIKAKMNEGENRTMVERCLNIIASGTKKTVETKLSKQDLLITVQFNSILPNDLKEAVEIATSAVNGGVMSKETAVDYLDMVEDKTEELDKINNEKSITNEKAPL
ncbi:phage portal protein [Flavobacterium sp. CBA20B-1]|uniref:phage portal protein n=1 Tax=unclassified Flavobacterium TaxID=196869 RepID=UPI002224630E|nr:MULTISPECIES: phage portal protein [unclassified Flavobacterium]WCM42395.1 phage portal protein [Flavobacterium sp. CBA20B-1]